MSKPVESRRDSGTGARSAAKSTGSRLSRQREGNIRGKSVNTHGLSSPGISGSAGPVDQSDGFRSRMRTFLFEMEILLVMVIWWVFREGK